MDNFEERVALDLADEMKILAESYDMTVDQLIEKAKEGIAMLEVINSPENQ